MNTLHVNILADQFASYNNARNTRLTVQIPSADAAIEYVETLVGPGAMAEWTWKNNDGTNGGEMRIVRRGMPEQFARVLIS